MRRSVFSPTGLLLAITLLAAGCDYERTRTLTSPSDLLSSFVGTWRSGSLSPTSCGNFQWQVTGVSGTTVTGNFSATCPGGITLSGTASGTPEGDHLRWTASGTATSSLGLSCPFDLAGTAAREGPAVRVDYSGSTCVGPVSGTELLRRTN